MNVLAFFFCDAAISREDKKLDIHGFSLTTIESKGPVFPWLVYRIVFNESEDGPHVIRVISRSTGKSLFQVRIATRLGKRDIVDHAKVKLSARPVGIEHLELQVDSKPVLTYTVEYVS